MLKRPHANKGRKQTRVPSSVDLAAIALPGEDWRPVVGWEKFYAVSNLGRVRSLHQFGRFVIGMKVGGGYRVIKMRDNGRHGFGIVHRMVLEAFVGPAPDGYEGCHCNGDPSDNRLVNLRWDTAKANQADRKKHGRVNARGTDALNADKVREIRTSPHVTVKEWSRRFGVSSHTIILARTGRTWAHVDTPPLFKR